MLERRIHTLASQFRGEHVDELVDEAAQVGAFADRQVGGFFGAYLGGRIFDATGSFDWVWYIDIVLAVGAALIHLPIKEANVVRKVLADKTA